MFSVTASTSAFSPRLNRWDLSLLTSWELTCLRMKRSFVVSQEFLVWDLKALCLSPFSRSWIWVISCHDVDYQECLTRHYITDISPRDKLWSLDLAFRLNKIFFNLVLTISLKSDNWATILRHKKRLKNRFMTALFHLSSGEMPKEGDY